MIRDILSELSKLDTSDRAVRAFGLLFAGLFGILTGILFWRGNAQGNYYALIGPVFLLAGLFFPGALRQVYRLWMLLAFTLGWITTRTILVLAYWIIMTPMGLLMRISGKDVLDERIDRSATSYWKKHEPVPDRRQYNKQF